MTANHRQWATYFRRSGGIAVQRVFDIIFAPLTCVFGVIGAVIRTVYWGAIVIPAVLVVSMLVSVGSTPKPVIPVLVRLGGRDLHRELGKILGGAEWK